MIAATTEVEYPVGQAPDVGELAPMIIGRDRAPARRGGRAKGRSPRVGIGATVAAQHVGLNTETRPPRRVVSRALVDVAEQVSERAVRELERRACPPLVSYWCVASASSMSSVSATAGSGAVTGAPLTKSACHCLSPTTILPSTFTE